MKSQHDLPIQLQVIPPQALEAEQAVLGAMMISPEIAREAMKLLSIQDFFRNDNRMVYAAAASLAERNLPTDILALAQELDERKCLDRIGGKPALLAMQNALPATAHLPHYAAIIREKAQRREVIEACERGLSGAYNEEKSIELVQTELLEWQRELRDRASQKAGGPYLRPLSELWNREFEPVRWVIDGLLPEGLTLLVGPPKRGKTILAAMMAMGVAAGGNALGTFTADAAEVVYLALEDSERRLQDRAHRILQDIEPTPETLARFYYETRWPRFGSEGGLPLLDDWLVSHPHCRLVILDILGRLRPRRPPNGNAYDEDMEFLAPIAEMAARRRVSILGLHHTNKRATEDSYISTSGSEALGGTADGTMRLWSKRGEQKARLEISHREFLHDKSFDLAFDARLGLWVVEGDTPQGPDRSAAREQILAALNEHGPLTPTKLAAILEKNQSTTQNLLSRMTQDRQVGSNAGVYYTLTVAG